MKKKVILFASIIIVLLGALCTVVFYSIPFVKVNSLLLSANKSEIVYEGDDNSFISPENYKKMRIVGRSLMENEYVQLKTTKKYHFLNWRNVDMICSVKATVVSLEKTDTKDTYVGQLKVSFSFVAYKWIVTNVEIV